MSPRVFPKLRRMHKYRNLPLCNHLSPFVSSLLSHFVKKKYLHGSMRTYNIVGRSPNITPWVLLLGEIPKNTHRNKKGVVYIAT
jgi:hypothetical protein